MKHIIALILWLTFLIGGVIGWFMNIGAIIGADFSHLTGLLIMRVIGVFIAPIGSILGLFF
jgi:hypothetical protein